ncbi:hypothetical protein SAMN06272775_7149 [Streptomyces sp. 2323.1]|uniref:hypothetical protein n=1 Tax=Streptomyces sp. 2323.1 TaxID=1938841 RepID=UPI000BC0CEEE|nr:hypothetical protein [Streptomyces sp. 2323.1]SOE16236.1 hypothetical protein SAMN06272775_7149 [Streptomyces sp. 2323.1]
MRSAEVRFGTARARVIDVAVYRAAHINALNAAHDEVGGVTRTLHLTVCRHNRTRSR